MITALLIDTVSIQNYIFGSNKLKENIGGSFIIEHFIYRQLLPMTLHAIGIQQPIDFDEWRSKPAYEKLRSDSAATVEAGYIGGGNALILIRSEKANAFIQTYSRLMLSHFPGIQIAIARYEGFDYPTGDDFKRFRSEMADQLIQNRGQYAPQTLPFKHGIVEDCNLSNEGREISDQQNGPFISQMSKARLRAVDHSQKYLREKYREILASTYDFTTQLDQLGQDKDKGYIAIVHADGNCMSNLFATCNNLAELRTMSAATADLADTVMENLIAEIVDLYQSKILDEETLAKNKETGSRYLPIRPLIAGGDDITFVCEGRLGVYLAEKVLKWLTITPIAGRTISACAGVAIVHTKYPFFRAYRMAEELTKQVKDLSRPFPKSSWLNYLISTGGFAGSLDDIIQQKYTLLNGKQLKQNGYRTDPENNTFEILKNGMKHFINPTEGWPRNKLKQLLDVLAGSNLQQKYFLAEMEGLGRKLPIPNGSENATDLWKNDRTPYHDMIELLDFYPQTLL